ncbi:MAG: dicarboxylate/amino acid:cation symporter [Elusimicrobiota bacterium]|jgi:Na+/H+-dicarboxylate symporter|nr:dicarboxylate/amino acid:cation symporter [Elusimicrobiota bacterium]
MGGIKIKFRLLILIVAAIASGIVCGLFFPHWITRIFITFNSLFGNFLSFFIPLLILGLIAPGISELGNSAGKLLLITTILAYAFTLFSGFFTYGSATLLYPFILEHSKHLASFTQVSQLQPYFTIDIPPLMQVMSSLVLAFVLGIGAAITKGDSLKSLLCDLRSVINLIIIKIIIPLLPIYIFGTFLDMTQAGQAGEVIGVFSKIIVLIFLITLIILLLQFTLAGVISGRNPFKMLKTMLSAYFTALGTQSSAATIPVTFAQVEKMGVRGEIASFTVPLCATIHLSGSTIKITACAIAIMTISAMPFTFAQMSGFIFMLGIMMIAAPGVPGGAIMAAVGILKSILGFNETAIALMIALYIAMDSFGTACNVTGDGAIAAIIDKIYKTESKK